MPAGDIAALLFEHARTGLLLLDPGSGRILEVNAAFARIVARNRNELIGLSFWEPPLIADGGAELWQHLCAGGVVEGVDLPLLSGDGRHLLLEISGCPVAGVIVLEVRDATGREQTRSAARMDTLRSFASRAAGEFQYLQQTLQMMGELLLVNAGQDRPVLRALEAVQQSSERASAIAEQLRTFSGVSGIAARRLSLNDLIKSMAPRLRQLFERDIEIVYDLAPDLEAALGDAVQLRQIILKLAANSAEAMGRQGVFCLQTRNEQPPGDRAAGPCVMLAVCDNGPGLDDESWAHLFEPLSSTKPNGRNLGLSLAATHGIVRQLGGHLWAHSEPGKGTAFRIYLPQAQAGFPALPAAVMPDRSPSILLVEANDGLRTVMANLLKKRGYQVLAAIDAQEGIRVLEAHGTPDLLICQPAPELVEHLVRMEARLRVLYLTGYDTDDQIQGLPRWFAVLRKPFEPDTLIAAVQQLLEQPL